MEVECSSEAQPLREDLLSSSNGRDLCGSWLLRGAWRAMQGMQGPGSVGAAATVFGRELREIGSSISANEAALERSPAVALLLKPGSDAGVEMARVAKVCMRASLYFHGDERQFFIVRLREGGQSSKEEESPGGISVADQLEQLRALLDKVSHDGHAAEGPWMWPLHDSKTTAALFGIDAFESSSGERNSSCLPRLLAWLHISTPPSRGSLWELLRGIYGEGAAYVFAWSAFYVQRLWQLAAVCAVAIAIGADPSRPGLARPAWEFFKVAVVVWGFFVFTGSQRHEQVLPLPGRSRRSRSFRNPSFDENGGKRCAREVKLVFVVFPILALFAATVLCILLSAVQFNIWLTYGWGDCVRLGCFDPETKHGFLGWVAEVGSDIVLAVVFDGLLSISRLLGGFAASLHNYQYMHEIEYSVEMHAIALEGLGKVLTYAVLAFVFVPQWGAPEERADARCDDLWAVGFLGETALSCLRRRLPLETRRFIFERTTKGPFIIAPFISIIVKIIVPWVADRLDMATRRTGCCCSCLDRAGDMLARLLALIFSYDGDSVGCFTFVTRGWPFSTPVPELEDARDFGEDAGPEVDGCPTQESDSSPVATSSALHQAALKPFEPPDELLELKLSFLWVVLFAPVRPLGVFPTLAARLLEGHADLTKMLFVRRRAFPQDSEVLHDAQRSFAKGAAVFAVAWSAGLSVLTYNTGLWRFFA